jgi:hypothetical protein
MMVRVTRSKRPIVVSDHSKQYAHCRGVLLLGHVDEQDLGM